MKKNKKYFTNICFVSVIKAKAKVKKIQTKVIFLVGPLSPSTTSMPKINPKTAPRLQKVMECHSSLIFIQSIVKAAAVNPVKSSKRIKHSM